MTLALGNNSGSGTLSGTLTEPTNASGVATFSDLSINKPGFGYTLTASSTGLTGATSNPFSESNTETTTATTVHQQSVHDGSGHVGQQSRDQRGCVRRNDERVG